MALDKKIKLIVILGPTASGKTKLAVTLAGQFNAEIVSADSRQVYRGMDIGTGKDLDEYKEIKHHLIDVVDPQAQFTLADFKNQADSAIKEIVARGRVPMLVGGSGLYLQAVVENFLLAVNDGPDKALRANLELKAKEELFELLTQKNKVFAERLNNSDKNNKRRLIRYIELQDLEGNASQSIGSHPEKYDCLIIGIMPDREIMEAKIKRRLVTRLEDEDMVGEVEGLRRQGVSDERLKAFGLEYRFITEYLEEKFTYEELIERLNIAIRQFAKRQITWFKRWEKQGQKIFWIKDEAEAIKLIKEFANNT
ncbi:MAG: tRNA (adenosine(37)-N6)-dimethylallyltransferase MiaA [bacterium]